MSCPQQAFGVKLVLTALVLLLFQGPPGKRPQNSQANSQSSEWGSDVASCAVSKLGRIAPTRVEGPRRIVVLKIRVARVPMMVGMGGAAGDGRSRCARWAGGSDRSARNDVQSLQKQALRGSHWAGGDGGGLAIRSRICGRRSYRNSPAQTGAGGAQGRGGGLHAHVSSIKLPSVSVTLDSRG